MDGGVGWSGVGWVGLGKKVRRGQRVTYMVSSVNNYQHLYITLKVKRLAAPGDVFGFILHSCKMWNYKKGVSYIHINQELSTK